MLLSARLKLLIIHGLKKARGFYSKGALNFAIAFLARLLDVMDLSRIRRDTWNVRLGSLTLNTPYSERVLPAR
jgi:hypothetical protein